MVLVEQMMWSWLSKGCGLGGVVGVVLVEQRVWFW